MRFTLSENCPPSLTCFSLCRVSLNIVVPPIVRTGLFPVLEDLRLVSDDAMVSKLQKNITIGDPNSENHHHSIFFQKTTIIVLTVLRKHLSQD